MIYILYKAKNIMGSLAPSTYLVGAFYNRDNAIRYASHNDIYDYIIEEINIIDEEN